MRSTPTPTTSCWYPRSGAARDDRASGSAPSARRNSAPAWKPTCEPGAGSDPGGQPAPPSRIDVPFAEQLAAMVALRDEGLIAGVGLSNVTLDQYRGRGPGPRWPASRTPTTWPTAPTSRVRRLSRPTACPTCRSSRWGRPSTREPGPRQPAVKEAARRLDGDPGPGGVGLAVDRAPTVLLIPGTSSPGPSGREPGRRRARPRPGGPRSTPQLTAKKRRKMSRNLIAP